MKRGIDISSYNGTIDMQKVKENEIEFIILRLFERKNKRIVDKKFYENYNKAMSCNIPVGIYVYSYAIDKNTALEEAKATINILEKLSIEYPVYIDMEDSDNYKLKNNVDYLTCVDICEIFCDYVEKSGYYAGIYANLDWLNNKINNERLDRFDKWVAHWSKKCGYKKNYGMWQYSSTGNIPGINGYVDLNYSLKDYSTIIKKNGLNKLDSLQKNHIVQAGDNLIKIAKLYNLDWEWIYNLNKDTIGDNPNIIKEGQKIIIRGDMRV